MSWSRSTAATSNGSRTGGRALRLEYDDANDPVSEVPAPARVDGRHEHGGRGGELTRVRPRRQTSAPSATAPASPAPGSGRKMPSKRAVDVPVGPWGVASPRTPSTILADLTYAGGTKDVWKSVQPSSPCTSNNETLSPKSKV
jgi:hypothetical protein